MLVKFVALFTLVVAALPALSLPIAIDPATLIKELANFPSLVSNTAPGLAGSIYNGPTTHESRSLIDREVAGEPVKRVVDQALNDAPTQSPPPVPLTGQFRPLIHRVAEHAKRVMDLKCTGPTDTLPASCSSPSPAPVNRLKVASDAILHEVRNNKEVLGAAREFVEKLKRTIEEQSTQ